MIRLLLPQTQVLSSSLIALPLPHAHLQGTLLPRGFFLGLGLIYLAALAVDRLAAHWRLPGAAGVLLLGLALPTEWLSQAQPLGPLQVETLHRVSLALLIFYAGHPADAAQVGLETGVEDQQRHAHPVQGLHLKRAKGLGLGQPLGGNHQAQKQHSGRPGHAPPGRQAIHSQSRQIDQPKAEEETAG